MSTLRSNIAMISGILTIRLHASLNDFQIDEWEWWAIMFPAVICLHIFIAAVSGEY